MEIQTDSVISNKDPEIFMINQFLFFKNKLVTSHGSFKNANHRDSGTVDQEAIYAVVSPVSETLLRVKMRRLRYRCRSNISIQVPVWCLLPGGNRLRCGLNGVGGDS